MPSLNKVTIIGNIGGEPEMRFTPNGKPVTSFRVATNWVSTAPDGERRQETEWFNVVTWNKLAEQCNEYLKKGSRIIVNGRIKQDRWQDDNGGNRSKISIVGSQVQFLDLKSGNGQQPSEDELY